MLDIDPILYAAIRRARELGGTVLPDRITPAAAGTGTSRASISTTYQIPPWAKMLLAVKPNASAGASAAAADVVTAQFDIQGSSFKRGPQQFIGPVSTPVLSAGTMIATPSEWWATFIPVQPLASYDWGVTPLTANTHNFKAGYDLLYSTVDFSNEAGFEPIVSQNTAIQAVTSSGTSTFNNAITTVDADNLFEVAGVVQSNGTITAAEKAYIGVQLNSSGLADVQTFTYGLDPTGVVISTSGTATIPKISRYLVAGMRFKALASNINYTANMDSTVSNAAQMVNTIRYRQRLA